MVSIDCLFCFILVGWAVSVAAPSYLRLKWGLMVTTRDSKIKYYNFFLDLKKPNWLFGLNIHCQCAGIQAHVHYLIRPACK